MAKSREPGRLKSAWQANQSIPRCVAALIESLSFTAGPRQFPVFGEPEWKAALYFFDRNQLTLLLRLPGGVQDANLARNQKRAQRMKQTFGDVSAALAVANIEFAVLKG